MALQSPSTLFKLEPAPWTCKCTAYVCTFWRSASQGLPREIYDPLEASSTFKSTDENYLGGLCLVQIIRYTYTPVGAYDELAILPGFFGKNGKNKHARVSRIYVSQMDTCYNGRKNWNLPKHMARFRFTDLNKGGEQQPLLSTQDHAGPVKVEVFANEASATTPFFSATLFPPQVPLPYLPFSSTWLTSLGINPPLLQPPLPAGRTSEECGTNKWKRSTVKLSSRKSSMRWCHMNMAQASPDRGMRPFLPADAGKWWARWLVALKMEDAILEIGEPDIVEGF